MKKLIIFSISFLIGLSIFVGIIKTVGWGEIREAFLVFSGWQGLTILGLTALMILSGLWKWKEILRSQGYNFSLSALARPYLAGFSITYLAPMIFFGGEIFRGYILKERHFVPAPKAYASVIIDRILELTIYLSIIFLGAVFFLLKIGLPPQKFIIVFGGVLIFFIAAIIFFYFKSFRKESIIKTFTKRIDKNNQVLETEREVFNFFKMKNKFMWRGFGFACLRTAINFVRTWILIFFLGKTVGFLFAVSVLGFYYLALMIPIPAALGSHDAIQAFAFGAFGIGANVGAAFTMIVRGAELIIALTGAVILLRLGIKLFEVTLFKKIEKFALK